MVDTRLTALEAVFLTGSKDTAHAAYVVDDARNVVLTGDPPEAVPEGPPLRLDGCLDLTLARTIREHAFEREWVARAIAQDGRPMRISRLDTPAGIYNGEMVFLAA